MFYTKENLYSKRSVHMSGSIFGNHFRVTTWGESHGPALGAVVDGCPAGLCLSEDDIQPYLDRRKPGSTQFATQRRESDKVQILSGVFEGKTTGTPISLLIPNTSQRSADYTDIAENYRPGHADYTFDEKYGFRDYRGGGRSSGRETAGRVAAGAIALRILNQLGIQVCAYTKSIGPVSIDPSAFDTAAILETPTCMPDRNASLQAEQYLSECIRQQDSAGGVIECLITGIPAGIGEPVFDKLDARLSAAVMSIGAVKAVELGDGTAVSRAKGSDNNDSFCMKDGSISKKTNHAGGILGGISDGSPVILRAHIKPTPSIFQPQQTVGRDHQERILQIKGRHDPVIVPRAVVVVESMAALTVLDLMLANLGARMDMLEKIYKR